MNCPDCCDKGTPGGCRECGVSREMTAQEREYAEYDRQDAARTAPCQVYRLTAANRPGMRCSLGTLGCSMYHGR